MGKLVPAEHGLPDDYWYQVFLGELREGDYAEACRTLGLITAEPPDYPVSVEGTIKIPVEVAAIFMLGGKPLRTRTGNKRIDINWQYVEVVDNQ
jgi:hypothetical protein